MVMVTTLEVVEGMRLVGWEVDGQRRVRDDTGALVGVLDAELVAELVEFFGVTPRAQA